MNIWITKDTKFGYRYTTNKSIRKNILEYFNEYLYNLLLNKSSKDDKFIIVGGLFSNTNPSIVAISDAIKCITELSNIIKVVLIPNKNDIRTFDGESFSTLSVFNNIPNVEIIENNFIYLDSLSIDVNNNTIIIDDKTIDIPNSIELEKNDNNIGIFISKGIDKYTIIKNKYSPKHLTFEINEFSDFDGIEKGEDFIHLIINNKLTIENKSLLNINIFKVKPSSIKYTDDINEDVEELGVDSNLSIIESINNVLGDDEKLKEQFNRILKIHKNKII